MSRPFGTTLTETLTKRQKLLDFMQDYYGRKRIPPTLQEMAKAVYGDERNAGNVSTNLVEPLIAEGFLYRVMPGGVRTIMLVTPQPREVYYSQEIEGEKVK